MESSKSDGRIRFGVFGASWIAPAAIIQPALSKLNIGDAVVTAIAARDFVKATLYAKKHKIPRVLRSYQELVEDPEIEAVYIGLPNSSHKEWTIKALNNNKHVLCEKPLCSNAEEVKEIMEVAKNKNLIVMEAFHYRYHPLMKRVHQLLVTKAIGKVTYVSASLQFPIFRLSDIRFQYNLGGGSLMDNGCYTANVLRFALYAQKRAEAKENKETEPTEDDLKVIKASADTVFPYVDSATRADVMTADGISGSLQCSLRSIVPSVSVIIKGEGRGMMDITNFILPHMLYNKISWTDLEGMTHSEKFSREETTYAYQLQAFLRCIRTNQQPETDLNDALLNMRLIDQIYDTLGFPKRGTDIEQWKKERQAQLASQGAGDISDGIPFAVAETSEIAASPHSTDQ